MLLVTAIAALGALLPRSVQDVPAQDGPTPAERARASRPGGEPAPVLGPDGKPLQAGVLPANASPEARAAWQSVVQHVLAPDPVHAFELSFYLRQNGEGVQTNETQARVLYLQPSYVRSILKSGREHLRGPRGDWLIDGEERVQLVGREGAEDVRQIDEAVGIARNFVALTDPASLRIASLALAPQPPEGLPTKYPEAPSALQWIELSSPDFRVYQARNAASSVAPAATPLFEVALGVDPKTQQIVFARIRDASAGRAGERSMLLVHMEKYERRDGFLVPLSIQVHEIATDSEPPRFREQPSSQLDLKPKEVNLRPELRPEDFLPGP